MLRGAEKSQGYVRTPGGMSLYGNAQILVTGDVCCVSPAVGDIHQVSNLFDDRVSISVHVYGADIGAVTRHVFDPETGTVRDFVSGYSNPVEAP